MVSGKLPKEQDMGDIPEFNYDKNQIVGLYETLLPYDFPRNVYGPLGTNLFVFHAPVTWTEEDLKTFFGPFGRLVSVRIQRESESGRSLGFGFVSFSHPLSAAKALVSLDRLQVENKVLRVTSKRGEATYLVQAVDREFQNNKHLLSIGVKPEPCSAALGSIGFPVKSVSQEASNSTSSNLASMNNCELETIRGANNIDGSQSVVDIHPQSLVNSFNSNIHNTSGIYNNNYPLNSIFNAHNNNSNLNASTPSLQSQITSNPVNNNSITINNNNMVNSSTNNSITNSNNGGNFFLQMNNRNNIRHSSLHLNNNNNNNNNSARPSSLFMNNNNRNNPHLTTISNNLSISTTTALMMNQADSPPIFPPFSPHMHDPLLNNNNNNHSNLHKNKNIHSNSNHTLNNNNNYVSKGIAGGIPPPPPPCLIDEEYDPLDENNNNKYGANMSSVFNSNNSNLLNRGGSGGVGPVPINSQPQHFAAAQYHHQHHHQHHRHPPSASSSTMNLNRISGGGSIISTPPSIHNNNNAYSFTSVSSPPVTVPSPLHTNNSMFNNITSNNMLNLNNNYACGSNMNSPSILGQSNNGNSNISNNALLNGWSSASASSYSHYNPNNNINNTKNFNHSLGGCGYEASLPASPPLTLDNLLPPGRSAVSNINGQNIFPASGTLALNNGFSSANANLKSNFSTQHKNNYNQQDQIFNILNFRQNSNNVNPNSNSSIQSGSAVGLVNGWKSASYHNNNNNNNSINLNSSIIPSNTNSVSGEIRASSSPMINNNHKSNTSQAMSSPSQFPLVAIESVMKIIQEQLIVDSNNQFIISELLNASISALIKHYFINPYEITNKNKNFNINNIITSFLSTVNAKLLTEGYSNFKIQKINLYCYELVFASNYSDNQMQPDQSASSSSSANVSTSSSSAEPLAKSPAISSPPTSPSHAHAASSAITSVKTVPTISAASTSNFVNNNNTLNNTQNNNDYYNSQFQQSNHKTKMAHLPQLHQTLPYNHQQNIFLQQQLKNNFMCDVVPLPQKSALQPQTFLWTPTYSVTQSNMNKINGGATSEIIDLSTTNNINIGRTQ